SLKTGRFVMIRTGLRAPCWKWRTCRIAAYGQSSSSDSCRRQKHTHEIKVREGASSGRRAGFDRTLGEGGGRGFLGHLCGRRAFVRSSEGRRFGRRNPPA